MHDLWLNCLRHFIKLTYLHVLVNISHRFLKYVNIYFLNFYLSHLIRKFPFWFFFPITHLYRYNAPLHVLLYHIYIWKWQESEESMYIDMWYVLNLTAWFGNTVNSNLNMRNHKEVTYKNFSFFSCNLTQHGSIAELITCVKYGISSVKFTNLCNPYWMDTAMLVHYF